MESPCEWGIELLALDNNSQTVIKTVVITFPHIFLKRLELIHFLDLKKDLQLHSAPPLPAIAAGTSTQVLMSDRIAGLLHNPSD